MIPLATVLTGAFNLGLNLVVVLVFILAFGVDPTWTWLLFPLAVAAALRLHRGGQHGALGPLRPLPRRRDHLDRGRPGALLRDADPLSGQTFEGRDHRTPADDQPAGARSSASRRWVLAEPQAPTAVEAAGGWLGLLPAAAIFVGICVSRLDLQPRGAADRRGPLSSRLGRPRRPIHSARARSGRVCQRGELLEELHRQQEEILRLRDLLIAEDAELGARSGARPELETDR